MKRETPFGKLRAMIRSSRQDGKCEISSILDEVNILNFVKAFKPSGFLESRGMSKATY